MTSTMFIWHTLSGLDCYAVVKTAETIFFYSYMGKLGLRSVGKIP